MSSRTGLIAGVVAVLVVGVAFWAYGQHEYSQGWEARDTQAKLDDADRNQAVFDERLKLEGERDYAELLYTNLKAATDAERDSFESVESRLRQQVTTALYQSDQARAGGGTYDADADWIGALDRKSVVWGKSGSARYELAGRR